MMPGFGGVLGVTRRGWPPPTVFCNRLLHDQGARCADMPDANPVWLHRVRARDVTPSHSGQPLHPNTMLVC